MAIKKEMTASEQSLFSEMKKLSKRANQRIVRLERLTGEKGTFATKQLEDYLSTSVLNVWTKKGRVGVQKGLTENQMKAIINATENFLKQDTSRVAGVKKFTKNLEEKIGKPISYKKASSYFQTSKNYTWIYQYMKDSSFWDFARESIKRNWNVEEFTNELMAYITDRTLDEELRQDIEELYYYAQGVKL